MPPDDSFALLLPRLQAGDEAAAAEVFRRFSGRLICLARSNLDIRLKQKVDPEDILQSVFKSFFLRQRRGEFDSPEWDDLFQRRWDGLWTLLLRITLCKCGHQLERFLTQRRDVGREVAPVVCDESLSTWQALDRGPTPDQAAMLADTVQTLLAGLQERDRKIVSLRLQDYSAEEVSVQLRLPERTVYRVLQRARERLRQLLDNNVV